MELDRRESVIASYAQDALIKLVAKKYRRARVQWNTDLFDTALSRHFRFDDQNNQSPSIPCSKREPNRVYEIFQLRETLII